MLQLIITYLAVGWAFFQTILFIWKSLSINKGNSGESCHSFGCPGCSAKNDLIKEIEKGKYPSMIRDYKHQK
ncbi:hypothetical protein DMA11_18835 [Marinilabiliaceae bacterium JC017]|nr:hypothetical protein DMA11_18835 [Marinilabiliaceae bacterium JC017]